MPTLGAALDFAKLEARNMQAHQLGTAPSSPVKGQLYYNTADNTLWWWDGSAWVSARGGAAATPPATTGALGTIQLAGDLAGTATSPQIAAGVITDAEVAGANKDGAAGTASMRTLGTGAAQAAAGNDSRLTDSRAPSGAAGGDLSGTYPNPQIGAGVITDVDVNAANKDGTAATASMRTLGAGAAQAMPGNRTLDAITMPAADVQMNGKKLIGLADPPTAQNDAATKNYVDNVAQGLDAKPSVKAVMVGNINLSGGAPNSADGISLAQGDRVLVKDQTTPAQNGIYTVNTLGTGSNGTWIRATDMDAWTEVPASFVFVETGATYSESGWVCTSDPGGTLGTTAITWVQFSGAGQITSGAGLTKTGNTLDVGAGAGITVNADSVQVSNNGITNAMIADGAVDLATADVTGLLPLAKGGTGQALVQWDYARRKVLQANPAATTYTIPAATHGCGAYQGHLVQVIDVATGKVEIPDVTIAANGDITIGWGVAPAANSKMVTIIGV